jgi:hypothetical protein
MADETEFDEWWEQYSSENLTQTTETTQNTFPDENSLTFNCSICGQLKRERHNSTSKYCRECYNGYQGFRGKVLRRAQDADKPRPRVTMDMYREFREREGSPVIPRHEISRGRPAKADPNDIRMMNYINFWKYVATAYQQIQPNHRIIVVMDGPKPMPMAATPEGWKPLEQVGLEATFRDLEADDED